MNFTPLMKPSNWLDTRSEFKPCKKSMTFWLKTTHWYFRTYQGKRKLYIRSGFTKSNLLQMKMLFILKHNLWQRVSHRRRDWIIKFLLIQLWNLITSNHPFHCCSGKHGFHRQFDVCTAFLYNESDEDFLNELFNFIDEEHPTNVYWLVKAFYKLK